LGIGEFVEVAAFAVGGLFLIGELEIAGVKLFEPFVPGDLFEGAVFRVRRAGELQANDSGLVVGFGAGYGRWSGAALLGPAANFVMVLSGLGQCHFVASRLDWRAFETSMRIA
jgi:hypothetical protein